MKGAELSAAKWGFPNAGLQGITNPFLLCFHIVSFLLLFVLSEVMATAWYASPSSDKAQSAEQAQEKLSSASQQ